jgi:N-acetylmuramoyl-L-alanine amidase
MLLKNLKFPLVSLFSCSIVVLSIFAFTVPAKNRIEVLVLDAGHGGKDPGTGGGKEKKYALDITLKLGERIKSEFPNVKLIYTRDSDVFVPLHKRADIANKSKADLFISVHCNALPTSNATRGTETYVMGLHKTQENLDLAKSENSAILFEDDYSKSYKGYNPKSPVSHIMMANYQNAYMNQSMEFASKIEKNMLKVGQKSRGVKQAGFIVIWETTMPSVLIETGYLTNAQDAAILGSEEGREKISKAIFKAFAEYKGNFEN